ncbi:hypothetical protein ACNKHS_14850 [Shigella flexneri]
MTAIANGIAHHGGRAVHRHLPDVCRVCRNTARMAALMKTRRIMFCTHDSIGWGWPTHQAVERLASLRLTPNFSTGVRAIGGSGGGLKLAVRRLNGPTALILQPESGAGGTYTGVGEKDCSSVPC